MFSLRPRSVSTTLSAAGRFRWALAFCAIAASGTDALLRAQTTTPLLVLQSAPNSPALNSITFGNQALGSSASKTITLSNAGGGTLTFSNVTISGTDAADFALDGSTCSSASLPTGGICTVTVSFHPSVAAKRSARLNLEDNALGSPQFVPLTGFGIDSTGPQRTVGPVDLRIGYPAYYKDQNALSLAPCIDDGALCLTPVPDLTRPPSVTGDPATTNFADEFFYYEVDSSFPNLPGKSLVELALEGAFNTAELIPGEQIVFGRIRIRISGLKPGVTYRVTHPYGHDDLVAEADVDGGRINSTEDFGSFSSPSDFSEVLNARIFPFLTWAPLSEAPAGFIGDPAVPHVITPGPNGNFIRLEELDANGNVVARLDETNLFSVSGRIMGGAAAPAPLNRAPVATDDTSTTTAPDAVTVSVLVNDSDPDGDPIQLTAVGAAANGTTTLDAAVGTVTYQPNAGFTGVDSFTYTIDDGKGGTATATVTVTVNAAPVNHAPSAVGDSAATSAGQPVIVSVLANDTDPDGDALSIVSASNGALGTTVVNSGLTITYAPAGTASGTDTFSYTISDGKGGTASAVVTVMVLAPNRAPVANADTASTKVGVPVNIDVVGGTTAGAVADTDPDGDPITLGSVGAFVNGTAAIQANGTVTFTPTAGFIGTGSFNYTVSDGRGATATGNVTVTVVGPTRSALAFADGTGARTAIISTTGPTVLVALVGSDGPTLSEGPNNQFMTISGGGLTWTRVQRAAASRGVSEIWTATAPAALTNAAVTSTQSVTSVLGKPVNQSLTVAAFSNASGVGASAIKSALSGGPNVSLVTTADGSLVYGVGNDFDQAIARTVGAGQVKIHEFLSPSGDTMWMQARSAAVALAGTTVTLNDTAPTGDQWNFAIVEIKP